MIQKAPLATLVVSNSNSNPDWDPQKASGVVKHAWRLGGCTRCLGINHRRINCKSTIRCAACFNYEHKFRFCLTKSQPKVFWRPKSAHSFEKPSEESEEARGSSDSFPFLSAIKDNPNEEDNLHTVAHPCATTSYCQSFVATTNSQETLECTAGELDMVNFVVNPGPFVPEGMEVEDWARPVRGRIIISGNPPRRHEEYAIVTVLPPLQQHLLYETMDEVVNYFEHEHPVRVLSSCLSPLGLYLIQFNSPIARQTMVNHSPYQLDAVREIVVEEHDRGLNLRNCPFTITCWVMFLAFPLDFQTRDIISLAVGHFGTVVTWTNNSMCKSKCASPDFSLDAKSPWLAEFLEAFWFVKRMQWETMGLPGQYQSLFCTVSMLMFWVQMRIKSLQMVTHIQ